MRKTGYMLLLLLSCLVFLNIGCTGHKTRKIKNVIVMIADGWGYNQIKVTDYWFGKTQSYENFPVAIAMSTYSQDVLNQTKHGYDPDSAWTSMDYLFRRATDSASSATAMSTGVKTLNKYIGIDQNKNPLMHLIDRAEELGMSTGVVTTVQFSHATPACFVARDVHRNNYSQIAAEMIDSSACEVIIGAGNPFFDNNGNSIISDSLDYKYVGDSARWVDLMTGQAGGDCNGDSNPDPWTLITTIDEFKRYAYGDVPNRILGVPEVHETTNFNRAGDITERNQWQEPYTINRNSSIPSLELMSRVVLNVLDNNPNGFFVMIEGGAIDWANHSNSLGRMIEEMADFNTAVDSIIAWVESNSSWDETLLIVTGDHECGCLLSSESQKESENSLAVIKDISDPGPRIRPDFHYFSGSHTNQLIPFYAKGKGADIILAAADEFDPRRGKYVDNTEFAKVICGLYDEYER